MATYSYIDDEPRDKRRYVFAMIGRSRNGFVIVSQGDAGRDQRTTHIDVVA